MEYQKKIAAMRPGDEVEGFYILQSAVSRTSAAGKPFMTVSVADRTGVLEGKIWDAYELLRAGDIGKVVKIRGSVSEYRGSLQVVISRVRLAEENDAYPVEELVPTAPIDAEETFAQVTRVLESMEDADYRSVCLEMLRRHGERFRKIPAAKSVHHSFLGGLLMHTSQMLALADFLAGQYAWVDRSLLLAGVLLHDFAKAEEFAFSELGLVTEYSVRGQLLGHLVMGAGEVEKVAVELDVPEMKRVLLQHMILSHHGEPEFGAAVVPMCAESELLALIDKIDSRMEIYRETLETVPVGEFSGRIFALEKKIYHHP